MGIGFALLMSFIFEIRLAYVTVGMIETMLFLCLVRGLDKSGYQVNIFLIPPRKHTLWVLIRSASARRF